MITRDGRGAGDRGPVIDPRATRPDLGAVLAEFLVTACAPASVDRFTTAAELRERDKIQVGRTVLTVVSA